MKTIFISLSLLLVSCVNHKIPSPHHYKNYAVQIIEVKAPIKVNRHIRKNSKGILSQSGKVINQYTVAYLPLGDKVTIDETTPLIAANAIGFEDENYIIYRRDEKVHELGQFFTVILGDKVENNKIKVEYQIKNHALVRLSEKKADAHTTLRFPVLALAELEGVASVELNRWLSLGKISSTADSSTHLLIRIIPPSLEGARSIVTQQIIKH